MKNPKERCISCGIDTEYRFNDHIDFRHGYIEGAGQLCKGCFSNLTESTTITNL